MNGTQCRDDDDYALADSARGLIPYVLYRESSFKANIIHVDFSCLLLSNICGIFMSFCWYKVVPICKKETCVETARWQAFLALTQPFY